MKTAKEAKEVNQAIAKEKTDNIKNWAEDISDALELFEELPDYSSIHKVSKIHFEVHFGGFFNRNERFDSAKWEVAKTASLAICKAWLKWTDTPDR